MTQQTKTSELFREYKAHPSIALRNQLVEENLYIVDILIRKYLGKGVDYDDLYQVGAIALLSKDSTRIRDLNSAASRRRRFSEKSKNTSATRSGA